MPLQYHDLVQLLSLLRARVLRWARPVPPAPGRRCWARGFINSYLRDCALQL